MPNPAADGSRNFFATPENLASAWVFWGKRTRTYA